MLSCAEICTHDISFRLNALTSFGIILTVPDECCVNIWSRGEELAYVGEHQLLDEQSIHPGSEKLQIIIHVVQSKSTGGKECRG